MKNKPQSNQEISKARSKNHQEQATKSTTKPKKAILMYISNNSGMATLLQQKNCMKTLTNGGGVGVGVGVSNTTNSNVSSSSGGSTIVANHGSSTGLNANGANTIVTHHHNHHIHSNHHSGIQQARLLRPHEMVSIPIGSIVSTVGGSSTSAGGGGGGGSSGGTATQGAFLVTGYQTTSHHNQHHHSNNNHQTQPLTDLSVFTNNSTQQQHKINTTMYSHSNYNAASSVTVANTTSAAGTTTQTRYFSQFSNNHQHPHQQHQQHHGLNSILYPVSTTTSTGTNSSVNRIVSSSHHHHQHPAANTNTNSTNSNVAYSTIIVKQELQPTNSTSPSSSSSNQLPPHLQINPNSIKSEPPFEDQQINGDKETYVPNGGSGSTSLANGSAAIGENSAGGAGDVDSESAANAVEEAEAEAEPEPEIDIVINNVVCSFSVRCHLNLREIALQGFNVEFRRENGMVTMKLRRPYTTASIWSSGRITCTGATSEDQAKIAARRYARCLQKLGFRVRFNNFRVVNVLGTCSMPFAIKIVNFSEKYKKEACYEPELHPGVTYKLRYPKATLKIFSTGSITVTAASVANVQAAIEHIFPLVYEFRKKRTPEELEILRLKQQHNNPDLGDVESEETLEHSPPLAKRKRRRPADQDDLEEDADDPSAIDANATDDIIMVSEYDDPDDLIEGPDDEDDDL